MTARFWRPPKSIPRDVLVNRWGCSLAELPEGARIGTSSPRRQAQMKNLCPQAQVIAMRGSVETRLRKASGEEYDGAILAAAGLVRLGLTEHVAEYLSAQRFVPPPGQGVLAVEIRAEDQGMTDLLRPIDHTLTRLAATAERAFLEKLGGGCQLPIRGNVDTRLSKAQGEDYDGAVLAAAGLIRLGLTKHISEYLSPPTVRATTRPGSSGSGDGGYRQRSGRIGASSSDLFGNLDGVCRDVLRYET